MGGARKEQLTIEQVGALGVKRVSLGGMMQAVAASAMIQAAREVAATGTFSFAKGMIPGAEIDGLLDKGAAK
jgi:2-methylisocitrate lyase-like PEP mutase family enzyme